MENEKLSDRNFDDLAERLQKKVYGSFKGKMRLELLREDLLQSVPGVSGSRPMKILDAGGGFGQVTRFMAELGHEITLCDISEKMIEGAAAMLEGSGLEERVTLIHSSFQDLPDEYAGEFDLVMLHAVLEWLAEPFQSLETLVRYIKPGGYLSLMFYNLHSMVYQNAIKGNFIKIMNENFRGDPNGLTPYHPVCTYEVETWCEENGIEVVSKTGIRVFHDYMLKQVRENRSFEDVLELEKKYCRKEPYASLGRYIHLAGRRT